MNVSKYLCWVTLKAKHRSFHHFWPNADCSTFAQQPQFLLKTLQKQSSGYSANSTSTSFISGSPSASTGRRLCVSASSDMVEASDSEPSLPFSEARLGVLVEGSDNWRNKYKTYPNERKNVESTLFSSPLTVAYSYRNKFALAGNGRMNDVFYVLFNSISVISGRLADDNERLCTMEPRLRLRWFRLERGSNSGPQDQLAST